MSKIRVVNLAHCAPSNDNPRKRPSETDLGELADSLAQSGLINPIIVREAPAGGYEIICGHRRAAAAANLGWTEIMATVYGYDELSDDDARMLALVENVQREDLDPLDEADAYCQMTNRGLSVSEIATRSGKSTATVYRRLALLDLPQVVLNEVRRGRMNLSVAVEFASIADPAVRADAAAEAIDNFAADDVASVRAFLARYRNDLRKAEFDTSDATLISDAPACGDCAKRSGSQTDLFGGVFGVLAPDICFDPACYAEKARAHADGKLAKLEAKGVTVLRGGDAARALGSAKYIKPGDTCWDDPQRRTWKQVVKGLDVQRVAVADEQGKVHQLLVAKSARLAAAETVPAIAASIKPRAARRDAASPPANDGANEMARREAQLEAMCEAVFVSAGRGANLPAIWWPALLTAVLDGSGLYGSAVCVLHRHGISRVDPGLYESADFEDLFTASQMKSHDQLARALVVEILMHHVMTSAVVNDDWDGPAVARIEDVVNLRDVAAAAAEAFDRQDTEPEAETSPTKHGRGRAKD